VKNTVERSRVHARCESCGATYRVSDPARTYPCKSCGGEVRASTGPFKGAVTCSRCGAVNLHGARFCAECGTPLGTSPIAIASEAEAAERRAATRELRRAYAPVGAVTWLYRIGAAAYAAVTVVAVLALASRDVPLEPGILVVGLSTVLTVTMLMGAIHVLFRPFPWTVAVAVLASLVTVAHLLGPNPLDLAVLFSAAWAAVFWVATVPTLRLARLIEEHTDLYITLHASRATKRSLQGRSAKERHQRLLRAMRRASRRAWRMSAVAALAVVLASALGTWLVVTRVRPPLLRPVLIELKSAWDAGRLDEVAARFPARTRQVAAARLAGTAEGHWGSAPPALGEPTITDGKGTARVDYSVGGVAMTTHWTIEQQRWWLTELELPPPPFEPVLERFRAGWRASDPRAIAALYPEEHRAAMFASIRDLAARRGWATFPAIVDTQVTGADETDRLVAFVLPEGRVNTEWLLRGDGRWSLHRFDVVRR
jgi:hypothetical protein